MKGTITKCLLELVETRFGADKWQAILADAKLEDASMLALPIADIDDTDVDKLLASVAKVLGIDAQTAADAFGEHWCCVYAPRVYGSLMGQFKDAKSLILGLDHVHVMLTSTMPNARPPRFDYKWLNERELEVTYKSHRHLVGLYAGLARGVGKYFKTPLEVTIMAPTKVSIRWI